MKDILKYCIWAGIIGVMAVPFIVANSMFFPFITGKAFTFRIIVEIVFGLWLILIMKDKEFRPRWSWVLGAAGVFVLVLLAADINAVAPYKAFWSNFERMEGFVTFIHLLAYILVLGSMLNTEKLWLWFFRLNITAGFILAIQSLAEGAKDNIVRIAGPLGNPIYISVYFLFIFFFTLILLYKDVLVKNLTSWGLFSKVFANILFYVYLAMLALSGYVVYLTSRGALLGLIGGIFGATILIAIFEKEKIVIKQISLGCIVMVIALVGVFLGVKDSQFVRSNPTLSRIAQISWSNTNGQARQLVWPMAIEGFKEKPILGWGQEGFNYVFNKYYDPKMYNQESWFDRAHNAPLDFLVAGGILGLLSYLGLFLSALFLIWFKRNNLSITERSILSGLFAGYLFQAIFVFDNLVSYIMLFTTLAYVHSRVSEDLLEVPGVSHHQGHHKNISENKKVQGYLSVFIQDEEYQNYILIPAIVILTCVTVWFINIPAINANTTLIDAFRSVQAGKASQGLEQFKKALSFKSMADSEVREQLLSYTPTVLQAKEVDQKTKEDFYNLTINEVKKQITLVPEDARYYFLLGSLLNRTGHPEGGLLAIKKAIELSPQKQAMRFELIQSLYSLGSSTEAMLEAKSAYELEKKYDQAKSIYIEMVQNEIKVNPKFKVEGEQLLTELKATSTATSTN